MFVWLKKGEGIQISELHSKYKVAVYCRLSRDDDNNLESESIVNQKRMLTKYVEEHGWMLYGYYIDDGYSGTAFNRPDFVRMLADIDSKKVNMVITKDLSRLGRDYIQTGYYLEVYFPQKNVRYVALNDNIDTIGDDNDIAPFKNILNEMYAKDISKKIRAAFKVKAENGEFIGAFAPYGYKKHPENKNRLVVDEEAAKVVKRAFDMAQEGCGLNKIARAFNAEGILNPSMYKTLHGSSYVNNLRIKGTTYWTNSTIRKMLTNTVYIGVMAQGKQRTKSFKCKKKVSCSEDEWIVVEGTHEPIIDLKIWDSVQRALSVRKRAMADGDTHMFSGLVKCADCGHSMSLGKKANGYRYFVCGTYKNCGPGYCKRHGIRYDYLYDIVLKDIRCLAELARYDEDAVLARLVLAENEKRRNMEASNKNELAAIEARIHEIDLVMKQLYEDRVKRNIAEKRFLQLSKYYEDEQEKAELKHKEALARMEAFKASSKGINYWRDSVKGYAFIRELDKNILNEMIDRILIGEKRTVEGDSVQEIKIVYKFEQCIPDPA